MGALGCGPSKGIKYQKRNALRVAPVSAGVKIDVWAYYRARDLERGLWIDDRRELEIQIEGQRFTVSIARKEFPNRRFKVSYSFLCKECGKGHRHLYYFDSAAKCRHCQGLYYRTYSHTSSAHLIGRDYDYLKGLLDGYERHYAAYERRRRAGERNAWQRLGTCTRPVRMRQRIERLRHQVKAMEARLWGSAKRLGREGHHLQGELLPGPILNA